MPQTAEQPILEIHGITKRFPGVLALDEVNLTLQRGEVLAVIGENGAGKSTLMKILAGVETPGQGQVLLDGRPAEFQSVEQALQAGIALIHQELNLADNLDVAANIFLGREPSRFGWMRRRVMEENARQVLRTIGLDVSPGRIVGTLPIGQQQLVEIAKALSINARVLIMDEPTSSLSQQETENLFRVITQLRDQGVSIVYISHRLGEVRELSSRVVVLRDGRNAGELSGDQIKHETMVKLMVGRDISQFYDRTPHEAGKTIFAADALVTPAFPREEVNLSIRAGEIVGLAGLIGAGRTELLQTIFGVNQPLGGRMRLNGSLVDFPSPEAAIRAGIALVPEDRKQQGLILEMSVRENVSLAGLQRHRLAGGFVNRAQERSVTAEMVQKLAVKTPHAEQVVQYLSGGNQQKVVLGKWLSLSPALLLLDEPTRGIDVGAKQEIYGLMHQLAADGVAILFASSEMEEILGMSDRTLVMHEGRITGELTREELSEEAVMRLATGGTNPTDVIPTNSR